MEVPAPAARRVELASARLQPVSIRSRPVHARGRACRCHAADVAGFVLHVRNNTSLPRIACDNIRLRRGIRRADERREPSCRWLDGSGPGRPFCSSVPSPPPFTVPPASAGANRRCRRQLAPAPIPASPTSASPATCCAPRRPGRAGDPCSCPHLLRGMVPGHIERVGESPALPRLERLGRSSPADSHNDLDLLRGP